MYVKWQGRKRQNPEFGGYASGVRNKRGAYLYNERGSLLRTRKRDDGSIGQDVRWSAILVEAVRVDGKPRQRHIACIGSITESAIEIAAQRRYFWNDIYERLDRLGKRMTIDQRRRLEAAIAAKVPRLSRAEHNASVRDLQKRWGVSTPQIPYRVPT